MFQKYLHKYLAHDILQKDTNFFFGRLFRRYSQTEFQRKFFFMKYTKFEQFINF